jgi:NTE family protein
LRLKQANKLSHVTSAPKDAVLNEISEKDREPRNSAQAGVALILQGGGARAAYQVGVLKALSESLGHPSTNPFPVIVGTSAGAINAAILASNADHFGNAVKTLETLWSEIEPNHIYRTDLAGVLGCSARWLAAFFFGALSKNKRISLFDNTPLHKLLARTMDAQKIQTHLNNDVLSALAITASGYTSGQNCAFFQAKPEFNGWKRSQRVGIRVAEMLPAHLMASSAIPFAFPAVKINREFFGDGSIRQTAPVSPALHLGASRIFVIGTAKLVKDFPSRSRSEAYPSLAQIAGHAMSSIFLDSLATDLELLQRVNSTIDLVDEEKLKASGIRLQHVDAFVACPNQPLEDLAHRHVGNLPATIRFLMRSIGAMRKGGAALASYLLFDKHYCRALIEMGYQDTIVRRDEIAVFFDPNVCPMPAVIPEVKFNPLATQQMKSSRRQ